MRENQRFTKGLFTWVGFKKKEVPYQVQPRAAGRTTWSYPALLSLAIEGITSFTIAPLRLTTALGLVVSAMAILYMLFVFLNTLIYGDPVAGYPTLMTVLLFWGGVQLLSLGIIGEYLGRVLSLFDVVSSGAAHYLLHGGRAARRGSLSLRSNARTAPCGTCIIRIGTTTSPRAAR